MPVDSDASAIENDKLVLKLLKRDEDGQEVGFTGTNLTKLKFAIKEPVQREIIPSRYLSMIREMVS
jgi:hypothetical protein